MANPNTIVLKAADNRRTFELLAGVAVNPGHLVEIYTSTTAKLRPHTTAYRKPARLFAIEQEYLGTGINVVTTSYAAKTTVSYAIGDQVVAHVAQAGDEIYAKVAASAVAIAAGDFLVSAGDGTLKLDTTLTAAAGTAITTGILADNTSSFSQTITNNNIKTIALYANGAGAVAVALEAVDNSANASTEAFIRVLVL